MATSETNNFAAGHSYNCWLQSKSERNQSYSPNINPNTITDNSVASKKNFRISQIAYTCNHTINCMNYCHCYSNMKKQEKLSYHTTEGLHDALC